MLLKHGLRCGTLGLMRSLQREGWEIWLYTLGNLPTRRVRLFFALNGISLGGIITGQEHQSAVRAGRAPKANLKHAPAFNLTLIADDKDATAQAGKRHGFETIIVTTCLKDWTDPIRQRCLGASQEQESEPLVLAA